MRIIHLVRATTWGGGERYAKDLCEYAVKRGHNVTVVTRGADTVDAHFREIGVELASMPLGGIFDLVTPCRLASLIRSMPEDEVAVHVHTFKDAELVALAKWILGHRKRVNLVCTRHLVKLGKSGWRWRRIYDAIDHLLFVSELARNEFLLGNPPVKTERIEVVHNSIIPPPPSPGNDVLTDNDTNPRDVRILFTGRISDEKGLDVLLKALALLKDERFHLYIAGTGQESYLNRLKSIAATLGVEKRVTWLGFVENVFAEIRRADICVAPSTARESFGLTIIEFMSQGKAVVTTSNGAQPEIITDRVDGLLVEAESARKLADALRILIENPGERAAMGKRAGDTFATRFSYPVFFKKIECIYQTPSAAYR